MKISILNNLLINSTLYNFFSNIYSNKIPNNLICNDNYLNFLEVKNKYLSAYSLPLSNINNFNYTGIKILNMKYIDDKACLVHFYIKFQTIKDKKINSTSFNRALLCKYYNKWLIYCIYDDLFDENIINFSEDLCYIKNLTNLFLNSLIKRYENLILNLYTIPNLLRNDTFNLNKTRNILYDSNKAVFYAEKYALNYNDEYQSFDKNGGDCTNFVSQVIHYGGIPLSSTWSPYKNSWIRVNELYSYLIYNKIAKETNNLSPGSIIQFFSPERKTWTHSGIITYTLNNDCLYCCHSYNKLNYPLSYMYPDIYPKIRILSIN